MDDELTLEELQEWEEMKNDLAILKEQEMALRKDIVRKLQKVRGTVRKGNKFKLQTTEYSVEGVLGFNYKFDKELLDENFDELSESEKACFSKAWKMSDAKFRKIQEANPNDPLDIYDIVTESEGAPTLKFSET